MKFQKPKGTKDILPKDTWKWHYVEKTIREVMSLYNFGEIRVPTFEYTELFKRGVGTETDIVGKEMYTFLDKNGDSLTLRPEGTASVMRSYLENGLGGVNPIHKMYYITNMFRYEKPQAGRYREHTQFGAEIIGSSSYLADVEVILLAKEVFNRLGIMNFRLKINSIGKPEERRNYINILKEYLNGHINGLSEESKKRIDTNTLRVLDSKNPADKAITDNAPKILDSLTAESRARFDNVLNELARLGVDFEVDYRVVRGLDYYSDTTFEFLSESLGAQDAIGGGGRYDGLIEQLGGKPTPGIGFGSGIERVIMVAEANGFTFGEQAVPFIFFASFGDEARTKAYELMTKIRKANVACECDLLDRSFKAQMREANRLGAKYVCILGEDELKKGVVMLKNMANSSQEEVPFDEIMERAV